MCRVVENMHATTKYKGIYESWMQFIQLKFFRKNMGKFFVGNEDTKNRQQLL